MAMLSGRSSLILMNSNAWMWQTSLAGIGARLVTDLKGGGLAALGGLESREVPMVLHDTLVRGAGPGEQMLGRDRFGEPSGDARSSKAVMQVGME